MMVFPLKLHLIQKLLSLQCICGTPSIKRKGDLWYNLVEFMKALFLVFEGWLPENNQYVMFW